MTMPTTPNRSAIVVRRAVRAAFLVGLPLTAPGLPACGQGFVPPANSNVVNVLSFGAVPNDGGDDIAAFQSALNAVVGTSRILYVPDGVYNFSGRLNWGGIGSGGFFEVRGQSEAGTILKLNDNAAGFGNPATPLVFIDAYEGNTANQFRNYLRDLTIDIGSGNTGAVGLQFQANNTGRIDSVTIRTSDPQKRGAIGLDQNFAFPGPMLIRNLTIDGFDTAYVGAPQEYSVTFENLTLRNQREQGMTMYRLPVQIRNLVSQSSAPVFTSISNPGAAGHLVIDGATITGLPGAENVDAFFNTNSGGVMLLRNVSVSGYRNAVNDQSFSTTSPILVPNGVISQFTTDPVVSLNPSPTAVLNVPVLDTPAPPNIPTGQWVSVKSFGAIENDNLDDTAEIQAALKSGAAVVYFPSGLYFINDTLEIGPSVQRVEGLLSEMFLNSPLATESKPLFRVPAGSQPVVHISGLQFSFASPFFQGGGVWLEQAAANTVVVRDGDLGGYRNTIPGGTVFLENIVGTNMVFTGQRVFARQLNPEGSEFTHVINDGGEAYILGLKTEGTATVLENRNRARTTVLGGLVYAATLIAYRTRPMVINNESSVTWTMPESCYVDSNNSYAVWIRETRNGSTTDFVRSMFPFGRTHSDCGGMLNLYNGYQTDATPASTPSTPTLVTRTTSSVQLSWSASTDAQSGIARYNIYRNGAYHRAVMPTATPGFTDSGLPDGTPYTYAVSAVNGGGVESGQSPILSTGSLADQIPPRLIGASAGLDPRFVTLNFSEPLAAVPAAVTANYAITGPSGPVAVSAVMLSASGTVVTLTTAPMTTGTQTIALTDLTDRASNPNAVAAGSRAAVAYTSSSAGTGLAGSYYLNNTFTGSPVLTRVDSVIDFDWTASGPGGGLPQANYAVRWVGQIRPRFTETYTLSVRSDDGSRLFIDGVQVVSNWADQAATERGANVNLDSSRTHDVVIEYYQATFGANMQFFWQSGSQPRQIVPQANLFPTPRLTIIRTFNGAGADYNLVRFSTDDQGGSNSMGAFNSPASGGFHSASYWRFDLAGLNLGANYAYDAIGTLSQTFFGIGDGRRQINIFGVNQSVNGDNWVETGPSHVNWDTAVGNDNSGALCDATKATWVSTFLLNNTNFQLNNQPDATTFVGPRIIDALNADTDNRVTFLAKRVGSSNEGQSWFTKEWGIPAFSPGLKVALAPRCPAFPQPPLSPAIVSGQSATITAIIAGVPPMTVQWLRNGLPVVDGPAGAASGGGTVFGAATTITQTAAGTPVSLTISGLRYADRGGYTIIATNACGTSISSAASLSPPCPIDFDGNGIRQPADIFAFLNAYFAREPRADFDGNGQLQPADIFAFLNAYFVGC